VGKVGRGYWGSKRKNHLNKNLPILTSSRKGIYLQDEYFNRIVASKDISNYKMIKKGEFTYRSMSDDETFVLIDWKIFP